MGNNTLNLRGNYGHSPGAPNLIEDLFEKALLSKGHAFSYEFYIQKDAIMYEKKFNWLKEFWKEKEHIPYAGYDLYKEDKLALLKDGCMGISYQEESLFLNVDKISDIEMYKHSGLKVTVEVDHQTSARIYTSALCTSTTFKEHILRNRRDILSVISNRIKRHYEDSDGTHPRYYIHCSGIFVRDAPLISSGVPYDEHAIKLLTFYHQNMEPLSSILQCYGLGLALVEYAAQNNLNPFSAYTVVPRGGNYAYVIEISNNKMEVLTSWL